MMTKYEKEKAKLLAKDAVVERKRKEAEEKMEALKKAMETGDTSVMDKQEEDEEDLLLKVREGGRQREGEGEREEVIYTHMHYTRTTAFHLLPICVHMSTSSFIWL